LHWSPRAPFPKMLWCGPVGRARSDAVATACESWALAVLVRADPQVEFRAAASPADGKVTSRHLALHSPSVDHFVSRKFAVRRCKMAG
jgi:hypothetical protein